jgi:hypothetical protein
MAMIVLQGGTELEVEPPARGVQKALSENQGSYCTLKRSGDEGRVVVKPEAVIAVYDDEVNAGAQAKAGSRKSAR